MSKPTMYRPLLEYVPTMPKPVPSLWESIWGSCFLLALPFVLIGLAWLFFSGLVGLFSLLSTP